MLRNRVLMETLQHKEVKLLEGMKTRDILVGFLMHMIGFI
jgi:hypothetical protein